MVIIYYDQYDLSTCIPNIPRSLLFGIEDNEYITHRELKRFNKSYWDLYHQKYKNYFDNTELFVIYETSLGETDSW